MEKTFLESPIEGKDAQPPLGPPQSVEPPSPESEGYGCIMFEYEEFLSALHANGQD